MKINILDIKIDCIERKSAIEKLDDFINSKTSKLICSVNTEMVIEALKDLEFKKILNNSSLNLADGVGILWSSKFQSLKQYNFFNKILTIIQWIFTIVLIPLKPSYFKTIIPEKISGSDFIWDICKFAATNKLKVFLLGGGTTIAERAALKLQTDVHGLRIAGVSSQSPEDTTEIIESIRKTRSDILIVAYGAPKQEKWLAHNLTKTGCKIGIGVGGSFDFLAGELPRAPKFISNLGLEWLFRLITQPSRIRRQLALPYFLYLNLLEKFRSK